MQTTEFSALQRQQAYVTAKVARPPTIRLADKKLKESTSQRTEARDFGKETAPMQWQLCLDGVYTRTSSVATAAGTETEKNKKKSKTEEYKHPRIRQ